ncbi:Endonuclease G, mitochondrial [Triplophysa tibetana]|uniref:Endonuclease G, mitochondrial n=1 Tax=Triplophysa tibetana TaxID=1572043 RepID=A0A5A9P0L9_9TELE|nr:Endonuclease G, mitochondrial [Triplophysa tibetana]
MNFFKSCKQQLPEPSLSEDDVTVDNILTKLLFYFGGFRCLIKAKTEIERKCEMEKKENYWSESDIKKAWKERERMDKKKKSAIKHWSRVIVLEELRRRLYDDKCKRQAEADVKEDEKTQACGNAPRKIGKTDEISFNTEPSMVSEERQIDNDYKKTRNNEEQVVINLVGANPKQKADPPFPYICIPLPFMSNHNTQYSSLDFRQTSGSSCKLIHGYPRLTKGQDSENEIRERKSYVMSYNNTTNNANWVYEILNKSTLVNNCDRVQFKKEYQKGHLAAGANHRWCFEAYEDASLFSNKAPQTKSLNKGMWSSLEKYCRDIVLEPSISTVRNVRNVHVYTGPCYSRGNPEEREFMKGKALPTHFFKVIIVEEMNGEVDVPECYLIPNVNFPKGQNYTDYNFDIGVIQDSSGLTFLKYSDKVNKPCIYYIKWEGRTFQKMGQGGNDESHAAEIEVRIFSELVQS